MKKFLGFLPLFLIGLFVVSLSACSDNDKDEEHLEVSVLPAQAKSFLDTYYAGVSVTTVTKDRNEYEVVLSNGHKVDFDAQGLWEDVDAPANQTIPTGFYPSAIDSYVAANAAGVGINEMSRETYGYEATLVNGLEYRFNAQGDFLGIDY